MPDTKPDLHFNDEGNFDACYSQEEKNYKINWQEREKEFLELVKKYKKHPIYDCVIGVSDGKNSTYH